MSNGMAWVFDRYLAGYKHLYLMQDAAQCAHQISGLTSTSIGPSARCTGRRIEPFETVESSPGTPTN